MPIDAAKAVIHIDGGPEVSSASASAQLDVELDHTCPSCKRISPAWVRGKATVTEQRPIFDLSGSDATFLAETEAQRNAALLIRITRCPHCGMRDRSELRKLAMRFVWALFAVDVAHVLFAVVCGGAPITWLYVHSLAEFGGLLGCVWAVIGMKTWRELRASNERVRFIAEPERSSLGPYRSAL